MDNKWEEIRHGCGLGCIGIFFVILIIYAVAPFDHPNSGAMSAKPTESAEPPLDDGEKVKRVYAITKELDEDKPVSELSLKDLQIIRTCKDIGLW